MGIYDRDYIKEEYDVTSSGRRYQARQILIGVNVFVWILWLIALDRGGGTGSMLSFMNEHFTASFWHLKQGFVHTLVTAAFSHSDLRHILFNMIALWIFAQMIEERYGYRNTFGIYIGCGVLSSLLHCLGYFTGPAYAQVGPALGASGSVMGLSVIAAMLHPKRIFMFMFVIPMQLWLMVTFYIGLDVLGIIGPQGNNRIANFAHLGGALGGFLTQRYQLLPFNADRGETFKLFRSLGRIFRPKPKLEVVKRRPVDDFPEEVLSASRKKAVPLTMDVESAREPSLESGRVDSRTAARVDEILEKISKHGMDALSAEEKAFLEESSRKYKK